MKRTYRIKTNILLFLCLSLTAIAQHFRKIELPTQSQLPVANIHCMMQDADGYLWYGTEQGGLCRDNGYQIDVFRPSDVCGHIKANNITCLSETSGGDVLIGTEDGLFVLDKHTYHLSSTKVNGTRIEALLTDTKGCTWVGVNGFILQLGKNLEIGKKHPCQKGDNQLDVRDIYEDEAGNLYVLQWNGGILRKSKNKSVFTALDFPEDIHPVEMVEDGDNHCFWLQTWGQGIFNMSIDGNKCQLTKQPASLNPGGNKGLSLLYDKINHMLWTTTQDNIYAYRIIDGGLESFDLNQLLSPDNKIVNQLIQIQNGSIFVSGYMPHTFVILPYKEHIRRLPVDQMKTATGYPVLPDRSVCDNGLIWIWQGRIGLSLYNPDTESLQLAHWKPSRCITRNQSDNSGIWAAEKAELYKVEQDNGQIRKEKIISMPDSQDIQFIHDNDNGKLTIATTKTLYQITKSSMHIEILSSLPSVPSDIAVSPQGDVFLISGGKVYMFSKILTPLASNDIFTSIAIGSEGMLWAATMNGNVYHYSEKDKELQINPFMQSRHDSPIHDIAVDGMGHVWTVSDQAVTEYNPQNQAFRQFAANNPLIDVSYFYGIETESINSLCLNGAGALVFVQSSDALQSLTKSRTKPIISSYFIDGEKHYVCTGQEELSLRPEAVDLTLRLTTLEQTDADNVSFAYQLEGFNNDWVYLPMGDNTIYFSNLSRGTYSLLVKATDSEGCWCEPICAMTIISNPHWYETWWAKLLFVISLILIGIALWKLEKRIRLLHRLIKRRQEVRMDEIEFRREDITRERLDDEFIRNALAAVESHLSDTNFNVEALASEMCMSRATLHRRMQAQTGMSPTEFIRDIRLKKAAQLFSSQPNATITDVATRVGFATPQYLTKCFREKFGKSPKDFIDKP